MLCYVRPSARRRSRLQEHRSSGVSTSAKTISPRPTSRPSRSAKRSLHPRSSPTASVSRPSRSEMKRICSITTATETRHTASKITCPSACFLRVGEVGPANRVTRQMDHLRGERDRDGEQAAGSCRAAPGHSVCLIVFLSHIRLLARVRFSLGNPQLVCWSADHTVRPARPAVPIELRSLTLPSRAPGSRSTTTRARFALAPPQSCRR
jgi:hypothetical protein